MGSAEYFCNPCIKEAGGKFFSVVKDSIRLAMYRVDPSWPPEAVSIRDQFRLDRVMIKQNGADQEYIVVPSRVTGVVTGVREDSGGLEQVQLGAPVPNPSGDGVTLDLFLLRAARVELAVFDDQGRRVRSMQSAVLPAGKTRVAWDGHADSGRNARVGLYFFRVRVEGAVLSRRVVVMR